MNRSNRISRLWGLMLAGGFLCSGLVLAQQDLGPAPASSSTALARAGGVLEKQASVEFSSITETCQQVAGVSFGPGGKWASCRVLASGFVATIGLQDFFFARYCLGENGAQCDSLAQVVFRNRAYRSEAHVEMVRFDPAGTQYERPRSEEHTSESSHT